LEEDSKSVFEERGCLGRPHICLQACAMRTRAERHNKKHFKNNSVLGNSSNSVVIMSIVVYTVDV